MTVTQQQPSTAMAIIDYRQAPVALEVFGEDRIGQVIEQIGRGWKQPMTLAELDHIGLVCQRTRLDPLSVPRQIWFIQRFDKNAGKYVMTPQTGINGVRLIASRSKTYAGQVGPQWCAEDGVWKDIWTSDTPPAAARVGVWMRGAKEPLWTVINYREFKGDTQFWREKPAHMLAKTAEMHSLLRACPGETNELELAHEEEMERLEVPMRAAEYARIHGSDEESFALGGPPLRPALAAHAEVAAEEAKPRPEASAPPEQTERHRGLVDAYASLVKEAIELHVIVGQEMDWIARAGARTDDELIKAGKQLRTLVNNRKAQTAGVDPQSGEVLQATDPKPEDQETGSTDTDGSAPAASDKIETVGPRSQLAQKLTTLFEEAGRREVERDDCLIASFPASKEEVIRAIEKLEDRMESQAQAEQAPAAF